MKPFWLFLLAGTAVACGAVQNPACSETNLAKLEANYIAEAVASCEGYTYSTCPALPAIRARYAAKRRDWIECR